MMLQPRKLQQGMAEQQQRRCSNVACAQQAHGFVSIA
jgi:hypothetical protein